MYHIYRCNKCAGQSASVPLSRAPGWIRYASNQSIKLCPDCAGPVVRVRAENMQKWPTDTYIRLGKSIGLTSKGARTFSSLSSRSNIGRRTRGAEVKYNKQIDIGDGMEWDEPEPDDPADGDFLPEPAKSFSPAMRYTPDGNGQYAGRPLTLGCCNPACTMTMSKRVKAKKGRPNATGDVMWAHYAPMVKLPKKMRNLSAFYWANLKCPPRGVSYAVDKKRSLEWCHLIADSLGGGTSPKNLVAASFAANTYMLAIEEQLYGQADYWLDVEAHCADTHVAEFISYTVTFARHGVKKPDSARTWIIDAREDRFTKDDYDRVKLEVKQHLA